eukprot:TRINITY_DN47209_c0_g1_i1.p1 TRINITY_DN47209_c0_g1~~TRINITY_DN47209_c0_g1_i1.p1  ORF type:complete len:322 (+),score=93.76 TRINITY_DN47209_c0_g1_i1:73-1038(+)
MVIARAERTFLEGGIASNVRADGRAAMEMRSFQVETDVVEASSGSARCCLGGTEVIVSVNAEIGDVDDRAPDSGRLHVAVSCAPGVAGRLDSVVQQQQRDGKKYCELLALDVGRVLGAMQESEHDSAREIDPDTPAAAAMPAAEAGGIDYKCLKITDERCWVLHMDVLVLAHDGNVISATTIGARAALLTTLLPKVSVAKDNIEVSNVAAEAEPIPGLADSVPITITIAKIAGCLVADPSRAEEACPHTSVSVGVTPRRDVTSVSSTLRSGSGDVSKHCLHPAEFAVVLQQAELAAQRVLRAIDVQLQADDEDGQAMDEDS